jgi:hypothetical protein
VSFISEEHATKGWKIKDNQKYIDQYVKEHSKYGMGMGAPQHSQWIKKGKFKIFSTYHPDISYEIFGPTGSHRFKTIKECKDWEKSTNE